ncbi:Gfo/Idh/MocA family protein [Gracilibacillus kekensis]|uniref:Virulence factor n=1 Tax=Gracilibacillus kekensis TaxID=1027249 RepID=A0A1M7QTA1_9BACI|nr:Gfo/Idh/MocA family oxidoreductase [Gracilibacillus kekensis]SHN34610.1 virulence factor [Gracilibacillus kekensis]
MKIGMIGIGDIAKKAYLPILTQIKDVELHVCTRNSNVLKVLKSTHPHINTYQSTQELIHSNIKAAFVHSSTSSHESIVNELLEAGIHIYVDKPVTYDGFSTENLINKAREKNLVLMVGFNRRYAPTYQKLKDIEQPNMVIMQKNRANLATDARRFIFDDFIHVIDTLLHLFPYTLEHVHIRGKHTNMKLEHIVLHLEAKEGTAIGVMNREAGTTNESVEVFTEREILRVANVSEMTCESKNNTLKYGQDNWESTLHKRGFHNIIKAFLDAVKEENIDPLVYDKDLKTHQLAEKLVLELK